MGRTVPWLPLLLECGMLQATLETCSPGRQPLAFSPAPSLPSRPTNKNRGTPDSLRGHGRGQAKGKQDNCS